LICRHSQLMLDHMKKRHDSNLRIETKIHLFATVAKVLNFRNRMQHVHVHVHAHVY
jgi:hypothetical protein